MYNENYANSSKNIKATKEPATVAHISKYWHLGRWKQEGHDELKSSLGYKVTPCVPPKQSPPPISHLPGYQLQPSAPSNHLCGLFLLQPRRRL